MPLPISHEKAQKAQKPIPNSTRNMQKGFCAFCAFSWLSFLDAEGAHAAVEVAAIDAHQLSGA